MLKNINISGASDLVLFDAEVHTAEQALKNIKQYHKWTKALVKSVKA